MQQCRPRRRACRLQCSRGVVAQGLRGVGRGAALCGPKLAVRRSAARTRSPGESSRQKRESFTRRPTALFARRLYTPSMVLIASYLAPVGYALAHLSGPADHAAAAAASLRPVRHRAPACQATAEKIDFSIAVPGKFSRDERLRSRYSGLSYVPEGGWGDDDVAAAGFSYEDMTASMGEITKFSRGETTTGTVIGFEPNGALVDIGVKSSAYCTVREAAPHPFAPLSFLAFTRLTSACCVCRCSALSFIRAAARDGARQARQAGELPRGRRGVRVCRRLARGKRSRSHPLNPFAALFYSRRRLVRES